MGVLESLLKFKAEKEAQQSADIQAIPQALMAFQAGRQQQQDNLLKQLTVQATLAKSGLSLTPDGKISRDPSFQQMNPVFTIDDQGSLVQAGAVPKGGVVKQLPQSVESIKEKSEARRLTTVDNPTINQDTQGALSAFNFMKPRLQEVNDILSKNPWGQGFEKIAKQIVINPNTNELIVPDDYKNDASLERLVGLLNDMRITGFGLGGKQLTETEQKIVLSGLDPVGKSPERFSKDLQRLPDIFKEKIKAGTMGLSDVKNLLNEESSNPSNQDDLRVGGSLGGKKILSMKKKGS